jgi:putative transposase
VFNYIEMFYNPTRKHTNNGLLSPVDYEMKQQNMNKAGVFRCVNPNQIRQHTHSFLFNRIVL